MKKEYNLKKMKWRKRDPIDPATTKLSITARLDMDIVSWLRKEADKKGLPYQTLMNSILKEVMQGTLLSEATLRKVIREELSKKVG
jgi:predicted DNA binding CopG/RHH family protein